MRSALSLVSGTPGRTTVSAVALTACCFVWFGYGEELVMGGVLVIAFGMIATTCWACLALVAHAAGADSDTTQEQVDD